MVTRYCSERCPLTRLQQRTPWFQMQGSKGFSPRVHAIWGAVWGRPPGRCSPSSLSKMDRARGCRGALRSPREETGSFFQIHGPTAPLFGKGNVQVSFPRVRKSSSRRLLTSYHYLILSAWMVDGRFQSKTCYNYEKWKFTRDGLVFTREDGGLYSAANIQGNSVTPGPLLWLCLRAGWPPIFPLQNEVQNIILQIRMKDIPKMTNKSSFL